MTVETKRLYFKDPYQWEFSAKIVDRPRFGEFPAVVLDQTCFYPEGGGQPSDKGTIDGMEIREVVEHEGRIFHVLLGEIDGDEVEGRVDGALRFDHMQQHAGQHVLSQVFIELFEAETRSFHLGERSSSLEIALPEISEQEVGKIEERANAVVFENREIRSYFLDKDKISTVPLRRPPKKSGNIRVVEIDRFDYTACGGTHPGRTGEIGLIKILRRERIRDNIRFEFLCGGRALRDYAWRTKDLHLLSSRMTVGEKEIVGVVEKLQADLKNQKKENRKLSEKLSVYEADAIVLKNDGPLIQMVFTDKNVDEVRRLALSIIKKGNYAVCFALRKDSHSHLICSRSPGIDIDLRELVPLVSPLMEGRGGGQPSLVQITGADSSDLEKVLEKTSRFIKEKLHL